MIEKEINCLINKIKKLQKQKKNLDFNSNLNYNKFFFKNINLIQKFKLKDYWVVKLQIEVKNIKKKFIKLNEKISSNNYEFKNSIDFFKNYSKLIKLYGNNVCKSSNLEENIIKFNKGKGINSLSPVSLLISNSIIHFYLYDINIYNEEKYIELELIQPFEDVLHVKSRICHLHTKDKLHTHIIGSDNNRIRNLEENIILSNFNNKNCVLFFLDFDELAEFGEGIEGDDDNLADIEFHIEIETEDIDEVEDIFGETIDLGTAKQVNTNITDINNDSEITNSEVKDAGNDFNSDNIEKEEIKIYWKKNYEDIADSDQPTPFIDRLAVKGQIAIVPMMLFPSILLRLASKIKQDDDKSSDKNPTSVSGASASNNKGGTKTIILQPPSPARLMDNKFNFSEDYIKRNKKKFTKIDYETIQNYLKSNTNPLYIENVNINYLFNQLQNPRNNYINFNNADDYYFNLNTVNLNKEYEKNDVFKELEKSNLIYRETNSDLSYSHYKYNNSYDLYKFKQIDTKQRIKKYNNLNINKIIDAEELSKYDKELNTFLKKNDIKINNYYDEFSKFIEEDIKITESEIEEFKNKYDINEKLIFSNEILNKICSNVEYYINLNFENLTIINKSKNISKKGAIDYSYLSYDNIFKLFKLFLNLYIYETNFLFYQIKTQNNKQIITYNNLINFYETEIKSKKINLDEINKTIIFVLEKYNIFNNVYNILLEYYFFKNFATFSLETYTKKNKYKSNNESYSNIIGRSELIRHHKIYNSIDKNYFLNIMEEQITNKSLYDIFGNYSIISYIDYESFDMTSTYLYNFFNNIYSLCYILKNANKNTGAKSKNKINNIITDIVKISEKSNCNFFIVSNYFIKTIKNIINNINYDNIDNIDNVLKLLNKSTIEKFKNIIYLNMLNNNIIKYNNITNKIPLTLVNINNTSIKNYNNIISGYDKNKSIEDQNINMGNYLENVNNINKISKSIKIYNNQSYIKKQSSKLIKLLKVKVNEVKFNTNDIPFSFSLLINISKQVLFTSCWYKSNKSISKNKLCHPILFSYDLKNSNPYKKIFDKFNSFKKKKNNKSKRLEVIYKNNNLNYDELILPNSSSNLDEKDYSNYILILFDNKKNEVGYIGSIKI